MPSLQKLLIMLMLVHPQEMAESTAGDVQAEYLALCDAWRVASKGQLEAFSPPADDANYLEILYYNASIADDKWKALLDTPEPEGTWEKMKEKLKATENKLEWEGRWDRRRKQRQHTKDSETGSWLHKNPLKQRGPLIIHARHSIQALAERAQTIHDQLKQEPMVQTKRLIGSINTDLQTAMCGSEAAYAFQPAANSCKTVSAAMTKATVCSTTENGKSIGNDLVCLCADASEEACGPAGMGAKAVGDTRNDRIGSTAGECPNKCPVDDLEAEIYAALAAVQSKIGQQSPKDSATILGKSSGATCTTSDTDNCVNYHNYHSGQGTGFKSIPCVKQLTAAAAAHGQYKDEQRQRQQLKQELKALKEAAQMEYSKEDPALPLAINQIDADDTESRIVTAKCKIKNKTAEECPSKHCDYDTKKQECKAKAGTENTATAGTEGTAKEGTTTSGCATHKDKTACENDKTGDKQNCAWMKGKDSQERKDKVKYQNGNFLINNNIVLSMDSAFVSWLAF
uniref:Variant surface glycoprotein 1125.4128 n=1 Tax=Trypanosoma brucei TaxID=5691 RepID=A0A1J0R9Z4_9TRYP|nr:variant surface glycoprotein 1125.4128 [Trypanosoma brucei]